MARLAYLDGGEPQPIEDIATLFRRSTQDNPDVEAVVSLHQKPIYLPGIQQDGREPHLVWTFKQLRDGSDKLAQRLASLGMCEGTSILMFSENCAEWALFIWAAIHLGCPFVPVNPAVTANVDELRHILRVICPGTVIVQDEDTAKSLDENAPSEISSAFLRVTLSPLKQAYNLEEQFPEYYTPRSQDPPDAHEDETTLKKHSERIGDKISKGRTIGWVHLPAIWPKNPEAIPFPKRTTKATFENTVTIGFTSGTTSFPKACPQSSENFKMVCTMVRGSAHRICQHGPPYHGIACFMSLSYWANGGTIVYPSPKFEAIASLDAVETERCNGMAAVPAMIKAFTMLPNISERRLGSLNSIGLAGAPVFPDTIQLCRDVLGIKRIAVNWGMSENPAPLVFLVTEETKLDIDGFFPVGKPIPGMKAKVCAPGSRQPLDRGVEGELHAGGSQVIRGYLNAGNHIFYEDEEGRWIITGDMASMDDDGNAFILGRYKDIIIRGGVNIAPANVERKLNRLSDVDSQVIGVPDEMAGEVPVAIVKLQGQAAEDPRATIAKLQQFALHELGPKLAPIVYVDLQRDLHMEMYPMSTSGKVKKAFLRGKVLEFLAQKSRYREDAQFQTQSTADILSELWSQVSGVASVNIDRNASVFNFVDSITAMRFSSAVRKRFEKDISVSDIVQNPAIEQQARLLNCRGTITANVVAKRIGPPTARDMAHCNGDKTLAAQTQDLATEFLTKLGLGWANDVEDVIPAPDTLTTYLHCNRPQAWNQRIVFIVHNTTHDELVRSWKATLSHHPIMRSLAISYQKPETKLLLTLRGNEALWSCSTFQNLSVSDTEELRHILVDERADPETGPLIKVAFANISSNPEDTALIFIGNHGVFDNMSINLFFEDLTTAIKNKHSPEDIGKTPGHAAFKDYADIYHLHRRGSAAMEAITFHANRLKGVGALESALWPQQRAPGWFKGTDSGWKDADGKAGDPKKRKPLDSEDTGRFGVHGLTRTVTVPGLPAIREKHGILPHVILKAAVTLFNVHRTGSSTALFANFEAARHWPFTADWASENQHLSNPLNITGPTFELVVNRIEVADENEPVLTFLQRIRKDQTELSSNSHVPLRELLNSPSLTPEDVAVIREIMVRQIWNWPPGIETQAQQESSTSPQLSSNEKTNSRPASLEKFTRAAYGDVGIAWVGGLWDKETLYMNASYDDCQLSKDEVFAAIGEVLSVASWLVQSAENSTVGHAVFEMGDGVVGGLIARLE